MFAGGGTRFQMPVADTPHLLLPVPEGLLALAPRSLPNYRHLRYAGDDFSVALGRLAARDQTLVRALYEALSELLYAIADATTDDAQKWQAVILWKERHDIDRFIDEVREIGLASHAQGSSEELCQSHARRARRGAERAAGPLATPRLRAAQGGPAQAAVRAHARPPQDHAQHRWSAWTIRAARRTANPRPTPCA